MAISLKTAGTWANISADPSSVAIPGTPAAGDRMFLFAAWKTYTITAADPSGWTPIGTEFADGTVDSGVGTGSVKVMAWYRDWQTGDGNPSVNWSTGPTIAMGVVQLWQKGVSDVWGTPTTVTGAIAEADPFTVNASATITVENASVVMCLVGFRDDSATMTRATDAIDDTGALVTWNGNYVESPATHFSSTAGQDMSGDLGHRFVTTGAAGVTLHADGDLSAVESGAAKFVLQALAVPVTGTGAGTGAANTASGTASETFTGSGAGGGVAATAEGQATETFTGTGAGTQAAATGTGSATETVTGSGAGTGVASTSSGTATETFTGTGAGTGAASSGSGTGYMPIPVTGTGAGASAAASATGAGLVSIPVTGTGAGTQARQRGAGTGTGGDTVPPEPQPPGTRRLFRMEPFVDLEQDDEDVILAHVA